MAASYAGAVKALKEHIQSNWTATAVRYVNETADPPASGGFPVPFVYFEVLQYTSKLHAAGTPNNRIVLNEGDIKCHVFVPVGYGDEIGYQHADELGRLFQARVMYDDVTPGCYIRTWVPRYDDGDAQADEGQWFRVTATIPFEYWHRV